MSKNKIAVPSLKLLIITQFFLFTCFDSFATQSYTSYSSFSRFDERGLLTGALVSDPDGSGPLKFSATRYTYNDASQLIKVEKGELQSWQSDAVAPKNWSNFTIFSSEHYSYNNSGLEESVSYRNEAGATIRYIQKGYDSFNRLNCEVNRLNPSLFDKTSTSACDATYSSTHGFDRVTKYEYENYGQGYGNLLRVYKAFDTPLAQIYQTYTYHADRPGLISTVSDANNNVTSYDYDAYARKSHEYFPDGTYKQFTYDSNANVTNERMRDGNSITFVYDDLNRMRFKRPQGKPQTVYTHKLNGQLLTANKSYSINYRPVKEVINYRYNSAGHTVSQKIEMDGNVKEVTSTFDTNGNRKSLRFPDNKTFNYSFDGLNRVTQLKNQYSQKLVNIEYNSKGSRKSLTRNNGSGAMTQYQYDGLHRLFSISHDLAGGLYDYDIEFGYNPANQIVSSTQLNSLYHPTINSRKTGIYKANALNQYTSVSNNNFSYDDNGNLTSDSSSGLSMDYDRENRLVRTSGTNKNSSFTYDPLGRLYKSVINGEVIYYIFDNNNLIAEYNSSNLMTKRYVHGDMADEPWVSFTGSSTYASNSQYFHTNHQKSVVAISDRYGSIKATASYDEYGTPSGNVESTFGYTGQIYFDQLNLSYYKARIYHPKLGRFLQTDPVGYEDQMNLYAYVGNEPINMTDPTGMYGRGKDWSDEDWEKFDVAQKEAASDMSSAASSMRDEAAGLKDGATSADGYSASELNSMADDLDSGAAALNDDGSGGYVANAVGSLEANRLAQATIGGKDVSVNVNHGAFGDNRGPFFYGHESLHSAGLRDAVMTAPGRKGITAYKYGSFNQNRVFTTLSKRKRYKNPDHIMSRVYP